MKKLTEDYYQEIKSTCHYCALTSFGIGTLIFILFLASGTDGLVMLGLYFTLFAAGINAILFLFNTFCVFFTEKYWKQYLLNSALLLVNIPIAFLYLYIVLEKLGF